MLRNGSGAGLSESAGCHARKEEINMKGINKKTALSGEMLKSGILSQVKSERLCLLVKKKTRPELRFRILFG